MIGQPWPNGDTLSPTLGRKCVNAARYDLSQELISYGRRRTEVSPFI